MDQTKRQSDLNESLIIETKRLRTRLTKEQISNTSMENLSNELFYEIFEYLDGFNIYKSFFNLNYRFQQVINCRLFYFRIEIRSKPRSELIDYCKNVILPNRDRIISLNLENEFFKSCLIDSSFTHLQSIVLRNLNTISCAIPLFYLKCLPCLFSLTMYLHVECHYNLNDIYRMILSLPCLKYNRLSLCSCRKNEVTNAFIPVAINEKLSSIEYLIIDHRCTLDELFSMLYHTPQLRHLTCKNLLESSNDLEKIKPMNLSNLTKIHIDLYEGSFKNFEIFIKKLFAPVEILRIRNEKNRDCLDAEHWEELIKIHMPYLRKFNYQYHEDRPFDNGNMLSFMKINQFTSSFWIERQLIFEFTMNIDKEDINGSLYPSNLRNIWIDIYKHPKIIKYLNQHSLNQLIPIIQLTIHGNCSDEQNQLFINKFKYILSNIYFTRLNINCKNICVQRFVEIIHLLPNIDSLKVEYFPIIQTDWLFDIDEEIRFSTSIKNRITKINLHNMIDIEQIHFLLYLCRRIQYFQIDLSMDIDLKILIKFILIKSNIYTPHFNSLCLSISNFNEDIIYQLQKSIESEKLLFNYNIKSFSNNILFKWNKS